MQLWAGYVTSALSFGQQDLVFPDQGFQCFRWPLPWLLSSAACLLLAYSSSPSLGFQSLYLACPLSISDPHREAMTHPTPPLKCPMETSLSTCPSSEFF